MSLFDIFVDAIDSSRVVVRDPHDPKWGYRPEKWTRSQEEAWAEWWDWSDRYLKAIKEDPDTEMSGPRIALIGAKGSGKTYLGALIAVKQIQMFPGSIGMVCSNTFPQVEKNVVPHLVTVARSLGLEYDYFNRIKIDGRPYSRVFVFKLDGGQHSFVVLTSFENIETIEGSEWDWQVYSELQQATREQFAEIALTRLRGRRANQGCYVDAMPADEDHWMYSTLESLGFKLWEPSLYENLHNVGRAYLRTLEKAYDAVKAQAYIHGKRISLNSTRVFYQFDWKTHVESEKARQLCQYDPADRLVLSVDFNVRPMCATVWQIKTDYDDEGEPFEVLAQVDEFEIWEGGTRVLLDKFLAKYGDHVTGLIVVGDAAGNQRSTIDPGTTDWRMIRAALAHIPNCVVHAGLIKRLSRGKISFSNPPIRDTINRGNLLLRDGSGRVRVYFLKSQLASGGCAKSVAHLQLKPDGSLDASNDRKEGRDVPRTHFADTFRYVAYWFTGGESAKYDVEGHVKQVSLNPDAVVLSPKTFQGRRIWSYGFGERSFTRRPSPFRRR